MFKKIVFSVVVLILVAGGFFYWQNNQKDIQELNKNLPKGVRVVKSLIGSEYKVVNKIDGYEFRVPKAWRGVKEIEYTPEREEKGFRGTSINIIGIDGEAVGVGIDRFIVKEEISLKNWAQNMFDEVGLVGDFISEKVGTFEIVKTQENIHLLGMYMYFFPKNNAIYSITGGSEEFIREIISNGRW